MAKTERELRVHQVKVSLRAEDAIDVARCARDEGIGGGTFIRRLVLRYLAAQNRARAGTPTPRLDRDGDRVKLGSHVSAWFTDGEYELLRRLVAETELTVSGYVGRRVIEPWLIERRHRLGSTSRRNDPRPFSTT